MWRFTFQCEKNAKEFIEIYATVAAKMTNKVSRDPPIVELESLIIEGKEDEDCVNGECNSCWNKGNVGEECDNCGNIMVAAVQHSFSDESSNSEEEEFDLPNTQDWPASPMMPFGKKEF